jgi:hypothetical protein
VLGDVEHVALDVDAADGLLVACVVALVAAVLELLQAAKANVQPSTAAGTPIFECLICFPHLCFGTPK